MPSSSTIAVPFLLGLLACPATPDACVQFCASAGSVQGDCLAAEGSSWEATADQGWGSEDAFAESCDTWVWASLRLERDARRRGGISNTTAEACATRLADLQSPDACATLSDWSLPWEDAEHADP